MSRIGNRIIMIPEGVTVENKDNTITVTGPKGTLSKPLLNGVNFEAKDGQIKLTIEDAKYVPPTPIEMLKALDNWEKYINTDDVEDILSELKRQLELNGQLRQEELPP